MPPTIKQVAEYAGVSMSTVSHVLNGTHYVSPELTERVQRAIAALNYEQNPVARILAGGRSRVIGVMVPDLSNSYVGEIIRGIDDELVNNGYETMIYTNRRGKPMASGLAAAFTSGMVAGLLFLVPEDLGELSRLLHRREFPYVLVDPFNTHDTVHTAVDSTNRTGAYEATAYLIGLGHRRIGLIMGSSFLECSHKRLEGYQAALADHGIPFDEALIAPSDFSQIAGYQAAEQLLEQDNPPTAIFASNDFAAFGVIDAARTHGLRVPRDLSVVGFDDIPQAAATRPALTTVRQPLTDMGRTAARLLTALIADPERPPEHVELSTELIIRESCQEPARQGSANSVAHPSREPGRKDPSSCDLTP